MINFLMKDDNYLFNSTTTGVCILDLNGRVKAVNTVFEELFGWDSFEMIGHKIHLLPHIPLELRFQLKNLIKHVQSRKLSTRYQTIRRRKNGLEICVDIKISPYKVNNNMVCGSIVKYTFVSVHNKQQDMKDMVTDGIVKQFSNSFK